MKNKLQGFIDAGGSKAWAANARKDASFMAWLDEKTAGFPEMPFPQRVYAAVHDENPVCEQGNLRGFNSITNGFRYCGRAAKCLCAAKAVSTNMKQTLSARTADEQAQINETRARTNIEKYGHENIGQSEVAKQKHAEFYADPVKVAAAVSKTSSRMMEQYGVANAFNLPEVNEMRRQVSSNLTEEARTRRSLIKKEQNAGGRLLVHSHARLSEKFLNLGYRFNIPVEEYIGVGGIHFREKFSFSCLVCGLEFFSYIYDGNVPKCPSCYPHVPNYVSSEEHAVGEFVKGLGIDIIRSANGIIPAYRELDIYIPTKKIAIEYCGLYWHSEYASERDGYYKKGRQYHLNKHLSCEQQGIRLLTIFSDEWNDNRSAVEDRLRHILGRDDRRIYARKTVCETISSGEAKTFLDTHHIQGAGIPASGRYGLKDVDGSLIAVMTFGKPRRSNNHTAVDGEWELYRFASLGSVVGGASKMFKAFVREHDPAVVRTFADRRWGDGSVYLSLGFAHDGESQPSYWYVEKYLKRHNRYNFTKHSLVAQGYDANLTEAEIMKERGFDIIWDCGNMKYKWVR